MNQGPDSRMQYSCHAGNNLFITNINIRKMTVDALTLPALTASTYHNGLKLIKELCVISSVMAANGLASDHQNLPYRIAFDMFEQ